MNRDFSASIGDVEVTEVWAQDYKLLTLVRQNSHNIEA